MLAGSDAAPAGRRRTLLLHSGGAGAPPAGTMTRREELATAGPLGPPEARRRGCPKGAGPECRRWGDAVTGSAARRRSENAAMARREAPHLREKVRLRLMDAPLGVLSPHFLRGEEMEDGLPGAAKNTGGGALAV